jgi:hypothetical protein
MRPSENPDLAACWPRQELAQRAKADKLAELRKAGETREIVFDEPSLSEFFFHHVRPDLTTPQRHARVHDASRNTLSLHSLFRKRRVVVQAVQPVQTSTTTGIRREPARRPSLSKTDQ